MREIFFRGKRADNGEWVDGDSLIHSMYKKGDVCVGVVEGMAIYQVTPETIGQYTGLTDKNGTKIFEGDIVRYAFICEYDMYLESLECPEDYEGVDFSDLWTVDIVVYGIELGYPAFDLSDCQFECNGLSELHESGLYFYEVIGNIHDNPELLKSEVQGDE